MEHSKIFLSISNFLNIENKIAVQENHYEKKNQKIINLIKIKLVFILRIILKQ